MGNKRPCMGTGAHRDTPIDEVPEEYLKRYIKTYDGFREDGNAKVVFAAEAEMARNELARRKLTR